MTIPEPVWSDQRVAVLPLRPLATASTVLVGVVCVASVFYTWTSWSQYQAGRDYLADVPGVDDQAVVAADDLVATAGVLYFFALLAAAIVFLVWLGRARQNAEWVHVAEHRLSRGWLVGSWFVPVVNLWFPYQVVADIWRTSDPAAPPAINASQLRGDAAVGRWWFAWVAAIVLSRLATIRFDDNATIEMFHLAAVLDTIATAMECLAGVLLAVVIRQITTWQTIPRTHPRSAHGY